MKNRARYMMPRNSKAAEKAATKEEYLEFKTTVRTGSRLRAQIAVTKKYKKRECIRELRDYVFGIQTDQVFVIYGL